MAFDLTLCLVPKQIETLLLESTNNINYAEWMQFIPELLKGSQPFDYQDQDLQQLKKDIAALKRFYHFTDTYYFYDTYRCFSTIDYLLNEHIQVTDTSIQPALLWKGGTKYPGVTAGQGMAITLYDKAAIEKISLLLVDLTFSDLLGYYDYEKMMEAGVYKLHPLESQEVVEVAFYKIRGIFLLALAEDLLVFKAID
ncbi:MAG: hypothetical protein EOO60_06010 [Hymenobacter sp.]|nr:MAG: hypothetical protein EOO60_06010 [Hymenobacter sp.]